MPRLRRRDHMLATVPAVILTAVASTHIWRWHHETVSAWRGGGFGMYSTMSDQRGRRVFIFVRDQHGEWQRAEPPQDMRRFNETIMVRASRLNLMTYGRQIACNPEIRYKYPALRGVRVDFREISFDSKLYTITNSLKESIRIEPCRQ
jgi:hypothetical protein